MNTTYNRADHQHGFLTGALVVLLAMIAVLVLAISLAPAASAETLAERCQRETAAYNAAWKAIGKKPPAPYKCGGSNTPPPTLSPSEPPTETPEKPGGPTTQAPESKSDGPNLNAPTERREIEHSETDQAPIGGQATPRTSNTPRSRIPGRSDTSGGRTHKPVTPNETEKQNNSGQRRGAQRNRDSGESSPFGLMTILDNYKYQAYGDTPPPSDPINDGCKYCNKDSQGRILNGPANSPDGWVNNWRCPEGTHNVNGLLARCYTDYDWYIENRTLIQMSPKPGEAPAGLCRRTDARLPSSCTQGMNLSNSSTQSASNTESVEGSGGVENGGASLGLAVGNSKTTETGEAKGIDRSGSQTAPPDLKPGEEIAYYQVWELWKYDIVSERNGEYKRYTAYQWFPTSAVQERRGPIGSNLQWK